MIAKTAAANYDIAVIKRPALPFPATRAGGNGLARAFIREPQDGVTGEAAIDGPDARMLSKLERRDREVRQAGEAKDTALVGNNYLYRLDRTVNAA